MASTKSATIVAVATLLVTALALLVVPATDAQSAPIAAPGGPSTASSPVPEGAFDCVNALVNMSDCLTYVEKGNNLSKPEKGCCPELAGLVESQPICLCQLLADPEGIIGIKIELKKALKLPSFCKLNNSPSASLCSVIGIPVGAPTAVQEPALSPGGFGSSPAAGNTQSAATRVTFSNKSFFLGLLAIMVFATLV